MISGPELSTSFCHPNFRNIMLNSFATLLCKKIAGIMCETRLTKTPLLRTEPRGPGSRTPAGRNCRDARKQLVVIRNFRYFRWSQTNILLYSFLTCRETIVFLCFRKDGIRFCIKNISADLQDSVGQLIFRYEKNPLAPRGPVPGQWGI